jgi:hypothetical protein
MFMRRIIETKKEEIERGSIKCTVNRFIIFIACQILFGQIN